MKTLRSWAIAGLSMAKALFRKPVNTTLAITPHPISSPTSPTYDRDYPLFNMDALRIPHHHRTWFTALNFSIRTFMNTLDASHNYQHIRRVVSIAHHILDAEPTSQIWTRAIDPIIVWVACMTHDVGDPKYREPDDTRGQEEVILEFLTTLQCPADIAREAAKVAAAVSFSAELRDPDAVLQFAALHPALRVVQDADRIDALGAVGMGRCFVFGGVNEVRRHGLLESGIALVEQRFGLYVGLMKTEVGRKMAEERYRWMADDFARKWREEADTSNV